MSTGGQFRSGTVDVCTGAFGNAPCGVFSGRGVFYFPSCLARAGQTDQQSVRQYFDHQPKNFRMNKLSTRSVSHVQLIIAAACVSLAVQSHAAGLTINATTITTVSVNGGADTINPGTTCIRISSAVSGACTSGFVAIPNNNKLLIAAALLNKTAGSTVWLYYDDATGSNHCPGQVFTPCSVVSIESK